MCDSNMASGLIWMAREVFMMVDQLIEEFSAKSSFHKILGSPKVHPTSILDILIMCNSKFINFILYYLKPVTSWEIYKMDFNSPTLESIEKLLLENLSSFQHIKFARAIVTKFDVLSELHKLCDELIKCIDNYIAYIQ